MFKPLLFLIAIHLFVYTTYAQSVLPDAEGGGSYSEMITIQDELTAEQRLEIIDRLQENEAILRAQGKLRAPTGTMATVFEWPLRQALNNNDNGYYGISNYIDHNPAFPNLVKDFNCSNRSYDLTNGYNHTGTDIFLWPYPWQKMARNAVEIIAAAAGTIIEKTDGNFDQNCAFCITSCTWNAVYIMHDDGSVAWYGHMKTGSLTSKVVGDQVQTGEYLGTVGSSGSSTGPHLHLEVYSNSQYNQLIDPWAGPCNNTTVSSWWANQESYNVPTLNKLMIHSALPLLTQCAGSEVVNEKLNFADGQQLFFASYFRDQQVGEQANYTVYRPDNTVFTTWTKVFEDYFPSSFWWSSATLSAQAQTGSWRYEVHYRNKRHTLWFSVNSTSMTVCPGSYLPIFSNLTGNSYRWQVSSSQGFINIADNGTYSGTATNQLLINSLSSDLRGLQYRCLVNGTIFSHTLQLKMANFWTGTKSTAWEDPANWSCGNVPDGNTDVAIYGDAAKFPEISSNASCATIYLGPGATMNVKEGFNLEIRH